MFIPIPMLMSISNGLAPGVDPTATSAGAGTGVNGRPILVFVLVFVRVLPVPLSPGIGFDVNLEVEGVVGVEADGCDGKEVVVVGVVDPLNPDQNES
jgi:hypothetical protein